MDTWSQKHSVHSLWSSAQVFKLYFQTVSSKALLFFWDACSSDLRNIDTLWCHGQVLLLLYPDKAGLFNSWQDLFCGMLPKWTYKWHLRTLSRGWTRGTKLGINSVQVTTFQPWRKRTGLSSSVMFISAGCKSFDFPKKKCSEFELFFYVFWLSFLSSVSSWTSVGYCWQSFCCLFSETVMRLVTWKQPSHSCGIDDSVSNSN